MIITVFKNLSEVSNPYFVDVEKIVKRIKNGNSKETIEAIRAESEKSKRNDIKQSLPCVLFSGKFSKRNARSLVTHSGLICMDIDDCSPEKISRITKDLRGDPYVYIMFVSPSGNGLKVVFKIPASHDTHTASFLALEEYLLFSYDIRVDKSGKDVSRICYESFDEDIYINKESKIFEKLKFPPKHEAKDTHKALRVSSSNDIIKNLQVWFDKNYSMNKGERNHNILIFAGALSDYGIAETEAITYLIQYAQTDFKQKEIEQTVRSAYKQFSSNFNTKHFEDAKKVDSIRKKTKDLAINEALEWFQNEPDFEEFTDVECMSIFERVNTLEEDKTLSNRIFWTYDDKGKVILNLDDLLSFINDLGFFIYYPNSVAGQYILVRVQNSIISLSDEKEIKDCVNAFVRKENSELVFNAVNNSKHLFSMSFLNGLPRLQPNILRDTRNTAYIPTKKCVYEVTKDGVQAIDYIDLKFKNAYVWDTQICANDFEYIPNTELDYKGHDFKQFVYNASGKTVEDFTAFCTTLGFLMHTFKDMTNAKTPFFFDGNEDQFSGEPEGGSGKSLLIEAIRLIRETVPISSDRVDFKRQFALQEIQASTQIVWIDEGDKNLDLTKFFSRMTGGMTIEKKVKDPFFLEFKDAPKFVFTTNYRPRGVSGSHERRKIELMISNHYSSKHSPMDEFKKPFFSEQWSKKDWSYMFTFLCDCIKDYLRIGIKKQVNKVTPEFKILSETCADFYAYWHTSDETEKSYLDLFKIDGELSVREHYTRFLYLYGKTEAKYSSRLFVQNIKKMFKLHSIRFSEQGKGERRRLVHVKS